MTEIERTRLNGNALAFMLAGNATFTFQNETTDRRFTFKVVKPREDSPHFVRLLNGPNNETDFAFLGTIFESQRYRHGRKSYVGEDAQSARAFKYLFASAVLTGTLPGPWAIWHEGRCGRCGRKLTVPSSIATGIGPVCAGKL